MLDLHMILQGVQAWVVERRGLDPDVADVAHGALMGLCSNGYRGRVLVITDNEPAILSLMEEMMRRFEVGEIPVESAPRPRVGKQRLCGNVVKWFKGVFRVYLLALEHKLEGNNPIPHPVMIWLLERVTENVTKYLQGAASRTGFEGLLGKQVHEDGLEFEERVLWRKGCSNDWNLVLDDRWAEGVWLGLRWSITHNRVAEF